MNYLHEYITSYVNYVTAMTVSILKNLKLFHIFNIQYTVTFHTSLLLILEVLHILHTMRIEGELLMDCTLFSSSSKISDVTTYRLTGQRKRSRY